MSNKEQLQTNNATLDALIARVNTAKNTAASLPEAGGGEPSASTIISAVINKSLEGNITITETSIPQYCLYNFTKITGINAPDVTNVDTWGCSYLTGATFLNFPELTQIKASAFRNCHAITELVLPKVTKVLGYGLYYAINATKIDLPLCTQIATYGFGYCYKLTDLILRSETVCVLDNVNAFINSPMQAGKTGGYVYVPRSLVSQYQVATNWVSLAVTFRAIEDYPDICG